MREKGIVGKKEKHNKREEVQKEKKYKWETHQRMTIWKKIETVICEME